MKIAMNNPRITTKKRTLANQHFFLLIFFILSLSLCIFRNRQIDILSTSHIGTSEYINIITNQYIIINKEDFAHELIDMYQNNSFKSMKLSTDFEIPTSIQFDIYQKNADLRKDKCIMEIEIKCVDNQENIRNSDDYAQPYQIYIDGKRQK